MGISLYIDYHPVKNKNLTEWIFMKLISSHDPQQGDTPHTLEPTGLME
jgi:hypothetical protein